MTKPALISVDWGTSSLRCLLLDAAGAVVARRDGGPGIQPPPRDGFAAVLRAEVGPWLAAHGLLPIVMSGMIGSRQGWAEVPYLTCPAGIEDLGRALHGVEMPVQGAVHTLHIVPGLAIADVGAGAPEVMRGEETQIVGALGDAPGGSLGDALGDALGGLGRAAEGGPSRLFVLPGTHSKWATTRGGRITTFSTYMTGEVFAALRHHSILGRLMPADPAPFSAEGFDRGVDDGAADGHPGALLSRLFATRTLGLFDRLPATALGSYLSGLLIGAELAAATHAVAISADAPVTIIANAALGERYADAAARLGIVTWIAPADCAARGHWLIARAANLIEDATA